MKGVITILFFFFLPAALAQQRAVLKLLYDTPAKDWMTEALPIGNGYMGVMFFGDPAEEHLQFSEGSLWAGGKNANSLYNYGLKKDAWKNLPAIRKLLSEGKMEEANQLALKTMTGTIHEKPGAIPNFDFGAQQTMGDLFIKVAPTSPIINYHRELDISNGVGKVSYQAGATTYTRTFFGNYPLRSMVYHFTSSNAADYSITLTTPHTKVYEKFCKNVYTYGGSLKNNQQEFETACRFDTDGTINYKSGTISIINATYLTVVHTAATDYMMQFPFYKGNDYKKKNAEAMIAAAGKNYQQLLAIQQKDYHRLFDRVSLQLGNTGLNLVPTDQRQEQYYKGNSDAGLEELYFQYGRYLMIAASRPGTMPMSLQGKWNNSIDPAWTNDYHTNINVEMLYWPAEITNLSECYLPLSDFTKSIVEPGRLPAQEFFNARGWTVNTMLNAYGYTSPGWWFPWGYFPGGAAWLSRHMWEHYLFTGDKTYLQQTAYPVMKEAALFWIDYLIPDEKGYLVSSPSYSPEHGGISSGATMDHELAWDILTNTIAAAEVLQTDKVFVKQAAAIKEKIFPLKTGRWGQLQEWKEDVDDSLNTHRHVSHLFGLYPGNQISMLSNPAEARAAKISLNARGDDGTGWSLAWKINFWSRLKDGDRAYRLLKNLLRPVSETGTTMEGAGGTYQNLLCAHPPFQLDGNMGAVAGIAEMLLQSQDGMIELLPALPATWNNGIVKGLKARGGYEVEMKWDNHKIVYASIHSSHEGVCVVYSKYPLQVKGIIVSIVKLNDGYRHSFKVEKNKTYQLIPDDSIK